MHVHGKGRYVFRCTVVLGRFFRDFFHAGLALNSISCLPLWRMCDDFN